MAKKTVTLEKQWGYGAFGKKTGWYLVLPSMYFRFAGMLKNSKGTRLTDLAHRSLQIMLWKDSAGNGAYASTTYIAALLNISKQAVSRAIKELNDSGYIQFDSDNISGKKFVTKNYSTEPFRKKIYEMWLSDEAKQKGLDVEFLRKELIFADEEEN